MTLALMPAIYHVFTPGQRQPVGAMNRISNSVIIDCSGAFNYLDEILGDNFPKGASMYAILGKDNKTKFQLKTMPEYIPQNECPRFNLVPIPVDKEEEQKLLKKQFPCSLGANFWTFSFTGLVPKEHLYNALCAADSLLSSGHNIVLCKDNLNNIRLVVSTLRGAGKQSRSDLMQSIS